MKITKIFDHENLELCGILHNKLTGADIILLAPIKLLELIV